MMKRKIFMSAMLATLLVGCNDAEETSKNDADKLATEEVQSNIDQQVSDLKIKIEEMQQNMDGFNEEIGAQGLEQYVANQITQESAKVEIKYGFIKSISENGEVTVDRVNMLADSEAPNGYKIEELNMDEVFQLNEKMMYFVVNEVAPEIVDFHEFKEHELVERLFTFTIIEGKLIMVKQQYLP